MASFLKNAPAVNFCGKPEWILPQRRGLHCQTHDTPPLLISLRSPSYRTGFRFHGSPLHITFIILVPAKTPTVLPNRRLNGLRGKVKESISGRILWEVSHPSVWRNVFTGRRFIWPLNSVPSMDFVYLSLPVYRLWVTVRCLMSHRVNFSPSLMTKTKILCTLHFNKTVIEILLSRFATLSGHWMDKKQQSFRETTSVVSKHTWRNYTLETSASYKYSD